MKMNTLSETSNNKISMDVNVILTFESMNNFAETQEIFDLTLPVGKDEIDAISFVNKQLFKRIVAECRLLNRSVGDLWKISTAGDWDTFNEITNLPTLVDLGHNCKWYFGRGAGELSEWEQALSTTYGFGIDTDMSWVGNPALAQQYMDNLAKQAEVIMAKSN
jgi:hypothetical protein